MKKNFNLDAMLQHLLESEASIPHLYQDVNGNITAGIGCIVTVKDVIDLPLVRKMDESIPSPTEKLAEYNRVKMRNAGLLASEYAKDCRLKLLPDGIKSLLSQRCAGVIQEIEHYFPETNEESFPISAYDCLFDMVFNRGIGTVINKNPKFTAAFHAQDFATCEREAPILDIDPRTGLNRWAARNAWQVEKLQAAFKEKVMRN